MKQCRDCQEVKPLEDFYPHKQMKDGRLNKCKVCVKTRIHHQYYRDHEKKAAYERERRQRPERKIAQAAGAKRRRQRYPDKTKARNALNGAVRSGKLTRPPCGICGDPKSQAHHTDYSKPLDVLWRCFKCHREAEHGQTCATKAF